MNPISADIFLIAFIGTPFYVLLNEFMYENG